MIPKIIHYCWMSDDPFPENIRKCMDSWKEKLPDYKFMLWNYDTFKRGKSSYVDSAFNSKKYAFCADYIRLYALYNYGGIYLDCDVEVLKPFDNLLERDILISKQRDVGGLEVAVFGAEKGNEFVKVCLDSYNNTIFRYPCMVMPNVIYTILRMNNFDFNKVLSYDYFSPKSCITNDINITDNTYTIHHFIGSWK